MQRLEIGPVLPTGDPFIGGPTARWTDISDLAVAAEATRFDTVWTADELLWRRGDGEPEGMVGMVAIPP